METTLEKPLVLVADDGSGRVWVVNDGEGKSWYKTGADAGWVPFKAERERIHNSILVNLDHLGSNRCQSRPHPGRTRLFGKQRFQSCQLKNGSNGP